VVDVRVSRIFVLVLFSLLVVQSTFAVDHIIVNSQDWRDVYSGMQYGYLTGTPANFLVSTQHSTILLYSVPVESDEVLVLSNKDRPFIAGYENILLSRGYSSPREVRSANHNLFLLEELEGVNRFIVLDDAYGYNAISVAPFAVIDKSYVIFANEDTIDDVVDALEDKDPENVLIYGQVDRAVKEGLAQFDPETINFGNRFLNNMEIVDRYQEIKPTKQVILTNGEFIEAGIMSGSDPVLFLGKENVPESVRQYITTSDIDVGILIGNELVNSATFVRRQLGISVFVKFAQGARQPTGSIATVEDLDRFPMPFYNLGIEITSIVYNKATGYLEVTYHNTQDLAEYFKSTITVRDGDNIVIISDIEAIFLDKGEYKTIVYQVDIDGEPLNFQSEDLSGDVFVVFGEGPLSLENQYQKSFDIDIVDILDDAEIEIIDAYYDPARGGFVVTIENIGTATAYVSAEMIEIVVNGEKITISSADVVKIEPGKKAKLFIEVELDEEDYEDNPEIRVRAYYGERELSRVKIKEETFPFKTKSSTGKYILYAVIVILLLLIFFFLGTKKKCPHCGHMNPRGRKTCERCGYHFKKQQRPQAKHLPPR